MKIQFLIVISIVLALLFTGCAEEIVMIKTPGGSYEFLEARLEDSYDGVPAEQGRAFLLVFLEGKRASMEDMENSFFSNEKSSVSAGFGGELAPCLSINYTALGKGETPDILAELVFDVPASDDETFLLAGDAIGRVTINLHKQKSFLSQLASFVSCQPN